MVWASQDTAEHGAPDSWRDVWSTDRETVRVWARIAESEQYSSSSTADDDYAAMLERAAVAL